MVLFPRILWSSIWRKSAVIKESVNPVKPGGDGGIFLPEANLDLNYFYTACGMSLKLFEFQYVGTVLVAELNIYVCKKFLVLHHLILSKDCVAYFADQLL